MRNRKIKFLEFIMLVALLMALVSLTINMLLPAFQNMADEFHLENKNHIQLAISLLYLGLGVGQLFYGPLSDSIGRKQTIYIGLILFIIGCVVSYKSVNMGTLITGQIIQGLGLGAPRVMSISIVRDQFEGNQMARAMSFIMVIYILTPTISPTLGKTVLMISGWRSLFGVFIFMSLFILLLLKYRMPETLLKENRKEFTTKHLSTATLEIIKNKVSMGYIIILGLYSAVFITYLNLSQAIFEIQYQLKSYYPLYFALLSLSIGLASFLNGKLVNRLGAGKLTKFSIWGSILASVTFLVVINIYFGNPPFVLFMIFMFVELFAYGILIGNLSALAMMPLGHIAGLGAAIIGAISTIISVPLSIFIGAYYHTSVTPIVIGFSTVGILSILIFNYINKIVIPNGKQNNK